MLIVGKKLNDKLGWKFGFPFNLGDFPLETWNFLGDGLIYEGCA